MNPAYYQMSPTKRAYHRWQDAGLCAHCGKAPPWNGTTICATCQRKKRESIARSDPNGEKRRERRRTLWNRRREQGLCVECGGQAVTGQARCAYHQMLTREKAHVRLVRARIKEGTWHG